MVNNIQEKMIEQVFKKNIFILLQIIWIIEFYILGFLAIDFAIKKDSYNEVFNLYFKSQDINQIEKIFKDYASKNFKDFKKDERKEVKEVVKEAKVKAEEHNKEVELNKNEKQFVKDRGDR